MADEAQAKPPLAPSARAPAATGDDPHDAALHHRSISDDAPSPSHATASSAAAAASPQVFTSAKASASAFASKIAFGGRKLLSPLAGVAGGKESASAPPPPPPSPPPTTTTAAAASTSSASTGPGSSGDAKVSPPAPSQKPGSAAAAALASSLAGANAAVSDAASAVTSSISYLFAGAASTVSASAIAAAATGTGTTTTSSPLASTPGSSTAPTSTTSSTPSSVAMDTAELEQLEAEFQQVTAQQRMQILEDLVQFRRADWTYIKAMHEGTNYWLNVALLRETQVLAHLGERAAIRRSVQFFYLGLGLGKLMSEVRHAQFLAGEGCQLLEELEYYFASATVQSMKLMVATSTPTLYAPLHKMEDDALLAPVQGPFRPTIYKWNQRPVFRRLVTPSIPFPLDYREVMLSLCDILALVYSKFVEDNTCSENVFLFQAIVRFDEKIKKLVIDPVKKEFSAVAATVMTDELTRVRRAFASGGSSHRTVASHPSPVASSSPATDTH